MAGNSIEVFPDALATAAGELQHAAQEGLALRGNFSRASMAAGACDPIAAEAYQQMQDALAQGLAVLQEEVGRFWPKTGLAGEGYAATERSVAQSYTGGSS